MQPKSRLAADIERLTAALEQVRDEVLSANYSEDLNIPMILKAIEAELASPAEEPAS